MAAKSVSVASRGSCRLPAHCAPTRGLSAHDQPLPGKLGDVRDLPQILLVELGRLEHTGSGEFLDRGGFQRGDPTPSASASSSMFALVTIPRSATTTIRESPNRSLTS